MSANADESLTPAEADVTAVRRMVEALHSLADDSVDACDVSAVLQRMEQAACRLLGADHVVFNGRVGGPGVDGTAAAPTDLLLPLRAGREVVGYLHVTAAAGSSFDTADRELAEAFAAAAGSALHRARLHCDARSEHEWYVASAEIARLLLQRPAGEILEQVVARARIVADADYGALIVPRQDGTLVVRHPSGLGAQRFRDYVFDPLDSSIGSAITAGSSWRVADLAIGASAQFDNIDNYGPAMLAPLLDARGVRGAVLLIRVASKPPFTERDAEHASAYAAQVGVALELDDARTERERLRALEDRHRIAQDLHDNVMQRLFVAGLTLQRVADGPLPADVAAGLAQHTADLDDIIDEIRTRVFGLRDTVLSQAGRHVP